MTVDAIVYALIVRAREHRERGWELMREGDPALLERAAEALRKWKVIAETREESARINHDAYLKLLREHEGKSNP